MILIKKYHKELNLLIGQQDRPKGDVIGKTERDNTTCNNRWTTKHRTALQQLATLPDESQADQNRTVFYNVEGCSFVCNALSYHDAIFALINFFK